MESNFIKQNWKVILICVLGFLFLFKSCQSCSRKQEISFYKYDSGKLIDSLQDVNANMQDSITTLNHNIDILNNEIAAYKRENKDLQSDKQHLRTINSKLANRNQK